jgi:putative tryptophan/tyrosine transport system substrate-binding protein
MAELLKEVAPRVTRIGVVRKDIIAAGIGQLATIQSIAQSFGVELRPIGVSDAAEIERAINYRLCKRPEWRLVALAARQRLPAVYPYRYFVALLAT